MTERSADRPGNTKHVARVCWEHLVKKLFRITLNLTSGPITLAFYMRFRDKYVTYENCAVVQNYVFKTKICLSEDQKACLYFCRFGLNVWLITFCSLSVCFRSWCLCIIHSGKLQSSVAIRPKGPKCILVSSASLLALKNRLLMLTSAGWLHNNLKLC